MDVREEKIIEFIQKIGEASSREVFEQAAVGGSYATLKRILAKLMAENQLASSGQGKGTRYRVSSLYEVNRPIDMERYYEQEVDERIIKDGFNFSIIREVLGNYPVFTSSELDRLHAHQQRFQANVAQLTEAEYKREFERLAIDLSWKSSQIEGNTYSLLETERLLKEKETAAGKTREEATMLLNHKVALDFILANPDYLSPLSVSKIEDIHGLLIRDLDVERNLRKKRIGISGTNFRPLDNEFQLAEALQDTCDIINGKNDVFEKALLALVLISYVHPFMDGNKRTSRIVSNALLMSQKHCPLSFRTVDSMEYKKAILLFYEQNNLSNFKKMFIDQVEFATRTYF